MNISNVYIIHLSVYVDVFSYGNYKLGTNKSDVLFRYTLAYWKEVTKVDNV